MKFSTLGVIHLVRTQSFLKNEYFYPLTSTHTYAYVRNINFSENFACVLKERPLRRYSRLTHSRPMLRSYGNQSFDSQNQLTGFYECNIDVYGLLSTVFLTKKSKQSLRNPKCSNVDFITVF